MNIFKRYLCKLINIYRCSSDKNICKDYSQEHQKIIKYFYNGKVQADLLQGINITQSNVSFEKLKDKFLNIKLPQDSSSFEEYNKFLHEFVLPYSINTSSPLFIGHMTSVLPSFMYDLSRMIAVINQNLVKIETSKSFALLERQSIAMLHQLFYKQSQNFYESYAQNAEEILGIVTSGGTTANISSLLYARNKKLLKEGVSIKDLKKEGFFCSINKLGYRKAVILGSGLMHYSIKKAAAIFGLGEDGVIYIDQDEDMKISTLKLEETILQCRKEKSYIIAMIGIAGATETGTIDDLESLAKIAKKYDIHYHVDAAWGGSFILSKYRHKLKGMEHADSITICGHKQFYLPQGVSFCIFKDPNSSSNAGGIYANYQSSLGSYDSGQYTIEGSRSALVLLLHAGLKIIGQEGYSWLLEKTIEKAKQFKKLIQDHEAFELFCESELNILNYRYIPPNLRSKLSNFSQEDILQINEVTEKIQEKQFLKGKTFVSKTRLFLDKNHKEGTVVFRAVISNPLTTYEDLMMVLEDQELLAKEI